MKDSANDLKRISQAGKLKLTNFFRMYNVCVFTKNVQDCPNYRHIFCHILLPIDTIRVGLAWSVIKPILYMNNTIHTRRSETSHLCTNPHHFFCAPPQHTACSMDWTFLCVCTVRSAFLALGDCRCAFAFSSRFLAKSLRAHVHFGLHS